MFLITESPNVSSIPKKVQLKKDKYRFEAVLQTVGDVNRNGRRYSRGLMESGIARISDKIREGSWLGELDHPISKDPVRQFTVFYKEVSHKICEVGWDGNKLIGILETTSTRNGRDLAGLISDNIPIGFSFRGMGELKTVREGINTVVEVVGPLTVVTYDSVSTPSHRTAKLTKIMEGQEPQKKEICIKEGCGLLEITPKVRKTLIESFNITLNEDELYEKNGMVCTKEGVCYIPNDFDRLVENRVIAIRNKFQI